jgi:hypothetical protein
VTTQDFLDTYAQKISKGVYACNGHIVTITDGGCKISLGYSIWPLYDVESLATRLGLTGYRVISGTFFNDGHSCQLRVQVSRELCVRKSPCFFWGRLVLALHYLSSPRESWYETVNGVEWEPALRESFAGICLGVITKDLPLAAAFDFLSENNCFAEAGMGNLIVRAVSPHLNCLQSQH